MLDKDVCVVIPTWERHLRTFEKCVSSCRKIDPLLIIAFCDNYSKNHFPVSLMPLVDDFIFSDRIGKGTHWIIQQKDALNHMKKYKVKIVVSLNGDCIIGKPEKFVESIKEFKESEYDIFSYFHGIHKRKHVVGTMAFMAKFHSLVKIIEKMERDSLTRSRESNESKMSRIIQEFGMSVFPVKNPESPRCFDGNSGTWVEEFSFAHLHF